jgi:hypothetical protein
MAWITIEPNWFPFHWLKEKRLNMCTTHEGTREISEKKFIMQPASNKILQHSTIDLADQENARIWSEVEQCFALVKEAGTIVSLSLR